MTQLGFFENQPNQQPPEVVDAQRLADIAAAGARRSHPTPNPSEAAIDEGRGGPIPVPTTDPGPRRIDITAPLDVIDPELASKVKSEADQSAEQADTADEGDQSSSSHVTQSHITIRGVPFKRLTNTVTGKAKDVEPSGSGTREIQTLLLNGGGQPVENLPKPDPKKET